MPKDDLIAQLKRELRDEVEDVSERRGFGKMNIGIDMGGEGVLIYAYTPSKDSGVTAALAAAAAVVVGLGSDALEWNIDDRLEQHMMGVLAEQFYSLTEQFYAEVTSMFNPELTDNVRSNNIESEEQENKS